MFVCAYCRSCSGSSDSVSGFKYILSSWCTYNGRNYHKECVKYHANRLCSMCKETQFETASGWTCKNGHGGAPVLEGEDSVS